MSKPRLRSAKALARRWESLTGDLRQLHDDIATLQQEYNKLAATLDALRPEFAGALRGKAVLLGGLIYTEEDGSIRTNKLVP